MPDVMDLFDATRLGFFAAHEHQTLMVEQPLTFYVNELRRCYRGKAMQSKGYKFWKCRTLLVCILFNSRCRGEKKRWWT
jgi:hypothetical protein